MIIITYISGFAKHVCSLPYLKKLPLSEFMVTIHLSKSAAHSNKTQHSQAAAMKAFFAFDEMTNAQQDSIGSYQNLLSTYKSVTFLKIKKRYIEELRLYTNVVPDSLISRIGITINDVDLKTYLKLLKNTLSQITLSFGLDLKNTALTQMSLMEKTEGFGQ